METSTQIKPLDTTAERLKVNRAQLLGLCDDFLSFAGVALPIKIITDMMDAYFCYEDCTPEQIKETGLIITKQIAFLALLGENHSEQKFLNVLLEAESKN